MSNDIYSICTSIVTPSGKLNSTKCNKKYFEKINRLDIWEHLLGLSSSIPEAIYLIVNELKQKPLCPTCNTNQRLFEYFNKGYRSYCSQKCSAANELTKKSRIKTLQENYGVDNISQAEHIKEAKRQSSLEKYGVDCVSKSQEIKDKVKETNLDRYGVNYPAQLQEFQDRIKATNLKKYGVSHYCKTDEYRDRYKTEIYPKINQELALQKRINFYQANYGVDNYTQTDIFKNRYREEIYPKLNITKMNNKRKITCMEKYKADYYFQSKEYKEKYKTEIYPKINQELKLKNYINTIQTKYGVNFYHQSQHYKNRYYSEILPKIDQKKKTETNINTLQEKYGADNISQIPEVQAKKVSSSFRSKTFIFPSGKEVKVQGYEGYALHDLLKTYKEDEIVTETNLIPKIKYQKYDGIDHTYFPDIFVPKDNLIIEVKSEYTLQGALESNIHKFRAVKDLGYNFKLLVYDSKGNLIV